MKNPFYRLFKELPFAVADEFDERLVKEFKAFNDGEFIETYRRSIREREGYNLRKTSPEIRAILKKVVGISDLLFSVNEKDQLEEINRLVKKFTVRHPKISEKIAC